MFDIKITGAEETKRELDKGVKAELKRSLRTLATKVRNKLKAATPRRTGHLASTVKYTIKDLSAYVGTSGSNTYYGKFINLGTPHMSARHLEGGMRVYDGGPVEYTEGALDNEIKQYEQEVISAVKGRFSEY